jgi:hypothetical protein
MREKKKCGLARKERLLGLILDRGSSALFIRAEEEYN